MLENAEKSAIPVKEVMKCTNGIKVAILHVRTNTQEKVEVFRDLELEVMIAAHLVEEDPIITDLDVDNEISHI